MLNILFKCVCWRKSYTIFLSPRTFSPPFIVKTRLSLTAITNTAESSIVNAPLSLVVVSHMRSLIKPQPCTGKGIFLGLVKKNINMCF